VAIKKNTSSNKDRVDKLIEKGVRIENPGSVEIGDEVDLNRISGEGVVVHAGCKIYGSSTLILQGCKIGYEAPVTLKDCYIGPNVDLKGGYFEKAIFLEGTSAGLGAHVRKGTILEEAANIAHTVGLKQTILFPFVTLGSLINFCDCLMAGGTSRTNHSEVGSSYIHFNYTPNQDKATASLIGDVPNGVMLNQRPIFLGGQGGLVGPCRLTYGNIIAAGTVNRKDELRPDRLIFGGPIKPGNIAFKPGKYTNEKRIVINNLVYIANLAALQQWYKNVRPLFVSEQFPQALIEGLQLTLQLGIAERIKRLKDFGQKMHASIDPVKKSESGAGETNTQLIDKWTDLETVFEDMPKQLGDNESFDEFMEQLQNFIGTTGNNYINIIKGLKPETAEQGTRWLQSIVDRIVEKALEGVPAYKSKA